MCGYVSPELFAGHCTYSLSDEAVTTALNRMTAGRHLWPNKRKQSQIVRDYEKGGKSCLKILSVRLITAIMYLPDVR